ncbi:PepSY domain-containing protein [Thiothrix lacustris]|uniref:PepSY domain-containing protein n=1 Tax=Thiothrix lacustris TaxID=525917 RepID=UPI0027E5351B|nr:PepSY domain-containing protein [Thiothrix lacustris]WMP18734.1 PepSY domain-containing protein [Thiothrix lacustris]
MNATRLAGLIGLLLIASLDGTIANAANTATLATAKQDIFVALNTTKITLDDAIQTAEHTVTGKLLKATLDGDNTSLVYKIAIADGNTHTITALTIDTITGKVLDSKTFHTDKRAEKASRKPGSTKTVPHADGPKSASKPF